MAAKAQPAVESDYVTKEIESLSEGSGAAQGWSAHLGRVVIGGLGDKSAFCQRKNLGHTEDRQGIRDLLETALFRECMMTRSNIAVSGACRRATRPFPSRNGCINTTSA